MQMLMDLGWDGDLTADERAAIDAVADQRQTGKQICQVVFRGSPLSMVVLRLEKSRAVVGRSLILFLCIENHSTQTDGIS